MSATGFDTCNPDSRFSGIQHLTSGLASIFRHTLKIIKELNDHDLRIYEDFTYVPYHEIINIFTFERIYIFYYKCLSRQLQSSPPLVVFYYSISLMVKIIAHCLHSVKRLKTRSLGRTVCFLQIRSLNCLIYRIFPVTPSYVLVTTALIAAKFIQLRS